MLRIVPLNFVIESLNYLRNKRDSGCFYLIQLSDKYYIREPYAHPVKIYYKFKTWHLLTKKI